MRIAASKRIKQSAPPQQSVSARMMSFPAATRGLIKNENLSMVKPGGASVLDNWRPTATDLVARGGSALYATIGSGARVGAILPYVAGSTKKLFAANPSAIYDITTVADPLVSPSAAVSGLTGEDWAWVQFTTSGGTFLRLCNGLDTPRVYDGSTWGTSPAITGVTAANLSHVWSFKNRLFFVEKNTLNAWYLSVGTIGGAATAFPLGGVFKLGGALMFGGSWGADTGSGLSEKCVFVTTEGEVAIYNGDDPGSNFSLEGVYRIGRPLGQRAVFRAGGDFAIATDIGIVPLSQAITTDLGALGQRAVTRPIEEEWATEAKQRVGTYPWHVDLWPTKQLAIVAMPTYSSLDKVCFVANIRTGAWARYTGWDTHCLGLYQDRMFFGTLDGKVVEAETGGFDMGAPYTCTYVGLFDDCGAPALPKIATLMNPVYLASQSFGEKSSLCFDYNTRTPSAPSAASAIGGSNDWETGLWEEALWSGGSTLAINAGWRAAAGSGLVVAPAHQVTIGQTQAPDVHLVRTDVQYTVGRAP